MKHTRRTIAFATLTALAGFALTAPAASAATMPRVMSAEAQTQALLVDVQIPTLAEVKAALVAAGVPVSALPDLDVGLDDQLFVISSTSASVSKTDDVADSEIRSAGEAAPLFGSLPVIGTVGKAETACTEPSCDAKQSFVHQSVVLPAPIDLGRVDIAGASSESLTYLSTHQKVAAVDIDLALRPLLDEGKPLAAVGAALDQVAATINTSVLPPINGAIDTIKSTVDGVAVLQPLKSELDRIITVDHVKPLPQFSKSDLVVATVLAGESKIADEVRSGFTGLRATASTEIIDLAVLGGWITADSIKVTADAFANSVKGAGSASAVSKMDVLNASLGGLLGIHVSSEDLIRLSKSETLKAVARDTLTELGVTQSIENLENAIELLYNVAGITIIEVPNTQVVGPTGSLSRAEANSLRIIIEPKLPKRDALEAGLQGGGVPLLAASDFVPVGLRIALDLPQASVVVGAVVQESFCIGSCVPISGLETKWVLAFVLFGAAIGVRRFVLSR